MFKKKKLNKNQYTDNIHIFTMLKNNFIIINELVEIMNGHIDNINESVRKIRDHQLNSIHRELELNNRFNMN